MNAHDRRKNMRKRMRLKGRKLVAPQHLNGWEVQGPDAFNENKVDVKGESNGVALAGSIALAKIKLADKARSD